MTKAQMKFPQPGNGYTIRSYLGGGNHKEAYRASSLHQARDVALLYFKNESVELIGADFQRLLRVRGDKPNAEHVAQLISFQTGIDNRPYLVEELLSRPLDKISPVDDIVRFVRIARDLSRGLEFLHSIDLIHRDIKLDNCGIDSQGRGKIFDLGCLTSDPGDVKGNVFSREPELFSGARATADKAADVWALGATLFALRNGEYPFVSQTEVARRHEINAARHRGEISEGQAKDQKAEIDAAVSQRALASTAHDKLKSRLHQNLRGGAEQLLAQMLEIDSSMRLGMEHFVDAWSDLANRLGSGVRSPSLEGASPVGGKIASIESFLLLVERRETSITEKQLERILAGLEETRKADKSVIKKIEKIENIAKRIKRKRVLADFRLGQLA